MGSWRTVVDWPQYEVSEDRRSGIKIRRKKWVRAPLSANSMPTKVPPRMLQITNRRVRFVDSSTMRKEIRFFAEDVYDSAFTGKILLSCGEIQAREQAKQKLEKQDD